MEALLDTKQVTPSGSFIEANTEEVSFEHLKDDCIIPVFAKDNETTISHTDFIETIYEAVSEAYSGEIIATPSIKVSHPIKGRIPAAMGKPAKELLDHEKTLYYERMAFLVEVSTLQETVAGNPLTFSIGGVRAYNQENLHNRKSLEHFKLFIGLKNVVCTNLCVFTDGESLQAKVSNTDDLRERCISMTERFSAVPAARQLEALHEQWLTEEQFVHLIGRLRLQQFLPAKQQEALFPLRLGDSQINTVVKEYLNSPIHGRYQDGSISLWNLFNLFTHANKSSYIDTFVERASNALQFTGKLSDALVEDQFFWHLN